jgi:hypothetical protein
MPAVDETETSWRVRQRSPGEFQEGSFRTIEITDGVKAVIGRPKSAASEISIDDVTPLDDVKKNVGAWVVPSLWRSEE